MKITNQAIIRATEKRQLYSALLELTYACNLDCFFCSNDRNAVGKPLSLQQYQTAIGDLSRKGVFSITLSGGEPLAHPEFLAIGQACRDNGLLTTIKSNGHALSETMISKIKRDIDPYAIDISLHGATAAVHDRQTRVQGSFKRLLVNIPRIRNEGIPVRINITATQWNEHQLEDMTQLALNLDCVPNYNTAITPRDDGDQAPLSIAPSKNAGQLAKTLIKRTRAQQQKGAGNLSRADLDLSSLESGDIQCNGGVTSVTIDPFGNILPCANWREPIGNLHVSSLPEILHSRERRRIISINQEVFKRVSGGDGEPSERRHYCIANALLATGKYYSD